MLNTPTRLLLKNGVSIWIDDLSRESLNNGDIHEFIKNHNVTGVTTNPTIFAQSIANKQSYYSEQIRGLSLNKVNIKDALFEITTYDVAQACDIFMPIFKKNMQEGRVSIEVDPLLAFDSKNTVIAAQKLVQKIQKDNLLIKVPATLEGIKAIKEIIGLGISVNVTLIFSLERYKQVINAYIDGLHIAKKNGLDISKIYSVASFFVSRFDTEINKILDSIGSSNAKDLKNTVGLANARLAYKIYEEYIQSQSWIKLKNEGANIQRLLWASTGVKDINISDLLYVEGLIAKNTVNTMPPNTIKATSDHGHIIGDTVIDTYAQSYKILKNIDKLGISYNKVVAKLEKDGLNKFISSWRELLSTVEEELKGCQK